MTLMWFRCHISHLTPTYFNGTLSNCVGVRQFDDTLALANENAVLCLYIALRSNVGLAHAHD